MSRATTALAIVQVDNKGSVLPDRAEVIVNLRLLPGDTIASVTVHVEDAVKAVALKGKLESTRLPNSSGASLVSPT